MRKIPFKPVLREAGSRTYRPARSPLRRLVLGFGAFGFRVKGLGFRV